MDHFSGVLRRRWQGLLVGVLLAVAAAAGTFASTSPVYSYASSFLLLPPKPSTAQDPAAVAYTRGNPLFYLGSLDQARDILISELASNNQRQALARELPMASYDVSPDALGSSPVVVISVKSASNSGAQEATRRLSRLVPNAVSALQQRLGVDPAARITTEQLNMDRAATVSHKTQIRAVIAVLIAVGLAVLLCLKALDTVLTREPRRHRRSGRTVQEDQGAHHAARSNPPPDGSVAVPAHSGGTEGVGASGNDNIPSHFVW